MKLTPAQLYVVTELARWYPRLHILSSISHYFHSDDDVLNDGYRYHGGISPRSIARLLKLGAIIPRRKGKQRRYYITEKARAFLSKEGER